MRLDSANRSFLAFMGVALLLGVYVLCGAIGRRARAAPPGAGIPRRARRAAGRRRILLPLAPVRRPGRGRCSRRGPLACRQVARLSPARASRAGADDSTLPDAACTRAARGRVGRARRAPGCVRAFSFVYGVLTPRVAVSRGLLEGSRLRSCGRCSSTSATTSATSTR